ncbi:MAG: hypothetical protein IKL79_05515 [Clostridia bacterium]|nr:hypothetical protein [Clostridia bacterium]
MNNLFGMESTAAYLERLLSFAIRKDAMGVARRLLDRFVRLDFILSARDGELLEIEGMTPSAVNLLKITAALTSRRITDAFELGKEHTDAEISDFFVGLYTGASVETIYMLVLDGQSRITSVEYFGEGTVGASDVYPRRLLEAAVKRRAAAVILAHNHPRGEGAPSKEDNYATEKLFNLFRNAGIELRAHYIVSERAVSTVNLSELVN